MRSWWRGSSQYVCRSLPALLMVDCSVRLIGRRGCGRCGHRQGLEIGHDGVDLVGTEMILKPWHVRGAAADELAHQVLLPAERHPGQDRAKMADVRELYLHMADHA